MPDISPISESELLDRRRRLRRDRRVRMVQVTWQILAVGGLTAGAVWAMTLPDWMLRSPQQVVVEGNRLTSTESIRSLLQIRYPQFLLTLQPQTIAQRLETEAPIAEATVTRRLFPPGLTIQIRERYPVAVVYDARPAAAGRGRSQPMQQTQVALLDEKGTWLPYDKYVALNPTRQLPELKVFGMREAYRAQWETLYEQISQSPVKILAIDWRQPGNLVLTTELGMVQVGAYGSQFPQQLRALDQMRSITDQVDLDQVISIDLRNPEAPLLELNEAIVPAPDTPEN